MNQDEKVRLAISLLQDVIDEGIEPINYADTIEKVNESLKKRYEGIDKHKLFHQKNSKWYRARWGNNKTKRRVMKNGY